MIQPVQSAAQILKKALSELEPLLQGSVSKRDFASLAVVARVAAEIDRLHKRLIATEHPQPGLVRTEAPAHRPAPDAPPAPRAASRIAHAARAAGAAGSAVYPSFRLEPDTLVKIGWSHSRSGEYEHRAPREAVQAVAQRIENVAGRRGKFTVSEIEAARPGLEVPNYQVYMTISWLKEQGLLRQLGRKGYKLATRRPLASTVGEIWRRGAPAGPALNA